MLDKRKGITDPNELEQLQVEKQQKINKLQEYTIQLKELVHAEKQQQKRNKDIHAAIRQVDSITFGQARGNKRHTAIEQVKAEHDAREKARMEHTAYQEFVAHYESNDSKTFPGWLFMHEDIQQVGPCPHVKLDDLLPEEIDARRKAWLEQHPEAHQRYAQLYSRIVQRTDVNDITTKMHMTEQDIFNFIANTLDTSQMTMWNQCLQSIKEYTSCAVKTKKLKQQFKILTHTLSILVSETRVDLHLFLSAQYNTTLVINELETKTNDSYSELQGVYAQQEFQRMVDIYIECKKQLEQEHKYCTNVEKNLKNELYQYLVCRKHTQKQVEMSKQIGKYFKKWTDLTKDEQRERFESYAEEHVQKGMVDQGILEAVDKQPMVQSLYVLLSESYQQRKLTYRDFMWNKKKGYIENVKTIRFDRESKSFYIQSSNTPSKKAPIEKRKPSTNSVLTKDKEHTINEEMLGFLIQKKDRLADMDQSQLGELQNMCIEHLKNKLRVKKISATDKQVLVTKFTDMVAVISNAESV